MTSPSSVTFRNLAGLYAGALHACTELTRPYLAGVRIERCPMGGVVMVATDGHRLSAAHDPRAEIADDFKPVILPINKGLYRHLLSPKAIGAVWNGETLSVFGNEGSVTGMAPCKPIAGEYPAWRRVIPTKVSGKPVQDKSSAFSAKYVAVYEKVAKAFNVKAVNFTTNSEGPVWVTLPGVETWHGVLMPRRNNGEEPSFPSWINS